MASVSDITIRQGVRPCLIIGRDRMYERKHPESIPKFTYTKAIWHGWVKRTKEECVERRNAPDAYILNEVIDALVEKEDGCMDRVNSYSIKFLDSDRVFGEIEWEE